MASGGAFCRSKFIYDLERKRNSRGIVLEQELGIIATTSLWL